MKRSAMALCGLLACVGSVAWAQDDVVASAGHATVTQEEITTMLGNLAPDVRTRLAADPSRLDQLVRARLAQKVVFDEAKAKGWDQQPQVKRAVEWAQRQAVADSYLASIARPPADYPGEQDIQSAYDENKAMFTVPYSLHFAQIFVAVPRSATASEIDTARKKAVDIAKQAHASGADFATLAKADSEDKSSAANGGDMGLVPQGMLLPEIRKVTDGMKPGEVSEPVQTAMGFHVIKLIGTQPATVRPLADVHDQIKAMLRQQRTQQNAQAYLAKAVGPTAVSINEDAVRKALSASQ
ncbi:peptidylprolyl isomerase [Burkholderia sp. WAC0059]|uniref:peptidylprolyl isomerase n=1 Tax=Burkholderia sp. WAC0059 TaxID=2066022 RepID=UPI000C7F1FDD|nr:peptidylprolyl isomerase [Burkholderia sp. WAC0059]PLZ01728.1 peptidylprolyl isomerase [Burkholderia sp. WAC0059]